MCEAVDMYLWPVLFRALKVCFCGLLLSILLLLHYTVSHHRPYYEPYTSYQAHSDLPGGLGQPLSVEEERGSVREKQEIGAWLRKVLENSRATGGTQPPPTALEDAPYPPAPSMEATSTGLSETTGSTEPRYRESTSSPPPARDGANTSSETPASPEGLFDMLRFRPYHPPRVSKTYSPPPPPHSSKPTTPPTKTHGRGSTSPPTRKTFSSSSTRRPSTSPLTRRTFTSPPTRRPSTSPPTRRTSTSPPTRRTFTSPPTRRPSTSPPTRRTFTSPPTRRPSTSPPTSSTHPPTETPDETFSPPPVRTPGGGYVVVNKVYEQQTMASGNLFQLQCWASLLNMSVVKPFMANSYLKTPLDESKHAAMLTFGDTFNETHWYEHTRQHGYLPLVQWREWVSKGPRRVIAVQLRYPLLSGVKQKRAEGMQFPHPFTGEAYKEGCAFNFISGNNQKALLAMGFKVVRKVCFNFLNGDEFTLSQFRDHIFGGLHPHQVSLVMDEWRGLGEPQRVLIHERICQEQHPFREWVNPSHRLVSDTERYVQDNLKGGDYVAVIARFEMTGLTRQVSTSDDPHTEIPHCIERTLHQLNQLRADTGINTTFLSIDIGKYGSISFLRKKYYGHFSEMSEFVRKVHKERMSLADVEKTLERVSGSRDAGYIAMLQQLIVTRAKCILFMGGGSFQRHALHIYQSLHPSKEDQCVQVVSKCTSMYRPIDHD